METDKKSHIFAHLVNNKTCKAVRPENYFKIIGSVSTPFRLKLKEAMHKIWNKPLFNKQQKHVIIFITVKWSFIFTYYFHITLSFPFITSTVLLPFLTFDLVSRCILNSICNHSNFVDYFFIIKFLIDTTIKTCKEQFYVMF